MTTDGTSIVRLLVQYTNGRRVTELVQVRTERDGLHELLHSPAFVPGIAAGDRVRLIGDTGDFVVVRRSGNLAIQIFHAAGSGPVMEYLEKALPAVQGWIEGLTVQGIVVTVPATADVGIVRALMAELTRRLEGVECHFGNLVGQDCGS